MKMGFDSGMLTLDYVIQPFQPTPTAHPTSIAGWMANPSPVPHPAASAGPIGLAAPNNAGNYDFI